MIKFSSALFAALLFVTSAAHAAYNNPAAPAGTNGQYQYNSSGALAGGLPAAGSGAALITGPLSSISGDLLTYFGTAGQAADSGISLSSVLTTASSISGASISGNISGSAANITGVCAIANGCTGATTAQAAIAALQGKPAFYPSNYGAKFNGVTTQDFTTTSGSSSITSASHSFTAADVGDAVSLFAGSSSTITGTTATGSTSISLTSAITGIAVFQTVLGPNIPGGTFVEGIIPGTPNKLVLSQAAIAASTSTFTLVNILNTTISSVSGGAAVLATAPSYSFSGNSARGSYGADDTTAVQAAINAANAAGGGLVQLPSGMAMISAPLIWYPNISMKGVGYQSSILKWSSTSDMTTSAPALIYGPNGSATTPYTNSVFTDFQVDMDAATETTLSYYASCITLSWTRNIVMTNMYMHGSPASCFRNDYAQNMVIDHNQFAHTGRMSNGAGTGGNAVGATYAETVNFPTSSVVSNNVFYDPGTTAILYQSPGTTNTKSDMLAVTGNLIYYDAYNPNITNFNVSGIDETGGYMPVITGNTVIGPPNTLSSASYGIGNGTTDAGTSNGTALSIGGLIGSNTVNGMGTGILLRDNGTTDYRVMNNNVQNSGNGPCIFIVNSGTTPLKNIEVSGNSGTNCANSGIRVATPSTTAGYTNLSIRNNKFYDNGTSTAATANQRSGIAIAGSSGTTFSGLVITGNELYDDGAATQQYGVTFNSNTTVTNALIRDNEITGNAVAPISFTDTTSVVSGVSERNGLYTYTITSSATPVLNTIYGDLQTVTLSANATPSLIGLGPNQRITFQICQPATGGPYTWTWPTTVHGGMTIGTTANTCSVQAFDSTNGISLVAENVGITNVAP